MLKEKFGSNDKLKIKYNEAEFIDPQDDDAENKAILSARISHETEINKILTDIKSILIIISLFLIFNFN